MITMNKAKKLKGKRELKQSVLFPGEGQHKSTGEIKTHNKNV